MHSVYLHRVWFILHAADDISEYACSSITHVDGLFGS